MDEDRATLDALCLALARIGQMVLIKKEKAKMNLIFSSETASHIWPTLSRRYWISTMNDMNNMIWHKGLNKKNGTDTYIVGQRIYGLF
jgi:hypothetical protein